MSPTDRTYLLEKKKEAIEKGLARWAAKHHLLVSGERLVFEIRLEQIPIVVGRVRDSRNSPRALLPADKRVGSSVLSYSLNQDDWDALLDLPWSDVNRKIVTWLAEHNNGPIASSQFLEICGQEWTPGMSISLGTFSKRVKRYNPDKSLHFQKIEKIDDDRYYAIGKIKRL